MIVKPSPFIVFALPRSRTAWLSRWLTYSGRVVGHDIAVECDTIDDFLDSLSLGLSGTVETGSVNGWRLVREALPTARIAVIFRPLPDVIASLLAAGFPVTEATVEQLSARLADMSELARQPGVLSVSYDSLNSPEACNALHEHLTGDAMDPVWWGHISKAHIVIDMPKRIERLVERREKNAVLWREVDAAVTQQIAGRWLHVGIEPWRTAWPDAAPLATAHFNEVAANDEPWRKFVPVISVMEQLCDNGIMKCITARRAGRFLGYMTWMVMPDIESYPLNCAQQGAWYADPAARGVGLRLLRRSIHLFRRMGIDYLSLHHRLNGRGADLSRVFSRAGAVAHQHNYNLFLKGT